MNAASLLTMVKHSDYLKIVKAIFETNSQLVENLDYEIIRGMESNKIYIVFNMKQEKGFVKDLKNLLSKTGIDVSCTFIFEE